MLPGTIHGLYVYFGTYISHVPIYTLGFYRYIPVEDVGLLLSSSSSANKLSL